MKFSKQEIQGLPTILDVMDILAAKENARKIAYPSNLHPWKATEEGFYIPVSMETDRGKIRCLSSGPCFSTYYRGQNCYYDQCVPTLQRIKSSNEKIIARLLVHEFQLLVLTHPIINELMSKSVSVNLEALAQHYGFATNMIDVSNDKWVAAFFATTKYDKGNYSPVDENFGDGYGVIYAATFDPRTNREDNEILMSRTDSIGFQYFPRPTSQSAYGFLMNDGENFNTISPFQKFYFRHDKRASEWVFAVSFRQQKYFPGDSLALLAKGILQDKCVSIQALNRFCRNECQTLSKEDVIAICRGEGAQITEKPKHKFREEDLCKDMDKWNSFGRNDFLSRVVRMPRISYLPYE